MTCAVYRDRVTVHPDRYGYHKLGLNRLIVVHDSETAEGATAAKALCLAMAKPGDRDNGSGGVYGSSYQDIIDIDCVWPAVPDDVTSYSAAGANHDGIHLCIPGRASQTREQWLDPISRPYVRNTAAVIVDKCREHDITPRRLTVAQVKAGVDGYCSHWDVSLAFRKSSHTDPGENFPWDVLAADIEQLWNPPRPVEEDDMIAIYTPPAGSPANAPWLCASGGSVRQAVSADVSYADKNGIPVVQVTDPVQYANLLKSAGLG